MCQAVCGAEQRVNLTRAHRLTAQRGDEQELQASKEGGKSL